MPQPKQPRRVTDSEVRYGELGIVPRRSRGSVTLPAGVPPLPSKTANFALACIAHKSLTSCERCRRSGCAGSWGKREVSSVLPALHAPFKSQPTCGKRPAILRKDTSNEMQSLTKFAGLDGALVLVTGGATGIGSAIVENFVRQGSRVIFLDINPHAAGELVAQLGPGAKITPEFVYADLKDLHSLHPY